MNSTQQTETKPTREQIEAEVAEAIRTTMAKVRGTFRPRDSVPLAV